MNIFLKNKNQLILIVVIFISLILFFTIWHPLYIYDTDDWTYISIQRQFYPTLKQYNPTKVLPETLYPFATKLGLILFYPIINDFIASMAIAYALVLSILITFYVFSYMNILKFLELKDKFSNSLIILTILLLHFLIFKENEYWFYGGSVNLIFNYTIPMLLNALIVNSVFLSDTNESLLIPSKKRFILTICIWLLVYLCINSNMWHSIILISCIGGKCLISLYLTLKELKDSAIRGLCKFGCANKCKILIIVCWLLTIGIESQGSRAKAVGDHTFFLMESIISFINSLQKIQTWFWLCSLCIFLLSMFILYGNKNDIRIIIKNVFYFEFISLSITIIYMILLGAKVNPSYLQAVNTMISWLFWIILIDVTSFCIIIWQYRQLVYTIPIIFLCMLIGLFFKTFKDNYMENCPPNIIKALDENIINQVKNEEKRGNNKVYVKVPKYNNESNWPIVISYGGDRISMSLYRLGVTKSYIRINLIADETINKEFGLE